MNLKEVFGIFVLSLGMTLLASTKLGETGVMDTFLLLSGVVAVIAGFFICLDAAVDDLINTDPK